MNFGERITQLRKEKGLNRKQFADYLGIPSTTLRNYEINAREPGHVFLKQVSQIFHVSIDYLLGMSETKQPVLFCNSEKNSLNEEEQQLIDNYRQLNEEGQERLLETSEEFLELAKYKKCYECEMAQEA